MLNELKENIDRQLKWNQENYAWTKWEYQQREETMKKNQTEILELKNTISGLKNSLKELSSRPEQLEEWIHELEGKTFKSTVAEE